MTNDEIARIYAGWKICLHKPYLPSDIRREFLRWLDAIPILNTFQAAQNKTIMRYVTNTFKQKPPQTWQDFQNFYLLCADMQLMLPESILQELAECFRDAESHRNLTN